MRRYEKWLLLAALLLVAAVALAAALRIPVTATAEWEDGEPAVSLSLGGGAALNLPLLFYGLTVGWGAVWLAWLMTRRKVAWHRVCFAIIFSMGVMLVLTRPAMPLTTWDEGVHRENILLLSGAESSTLSDYLFTYTTWFFGYMPYALGAALGRLLGLGDGWILRAANLLAVLVQAAVSALAVKHAPRYKLTFLTLAALPTCIWLASSASYDGTVISYVLLGTALLLEELDTPDRFLEGHRAVILLAVLCVGTLAKPAYSLLILMIWLLPRAKFAGSRRNAAFKAFAMLMMVMCLLSMLTGAYDDLMAGDPRTDDTDSAGQLAYVLANPGAALGTLGRYILREVPALYGQAADFWCALGASPLISALLLVIAAFSTLIAVDEGEGGLCLTVMRRLALICLGFLPMLALIGSQYMVTTPPGMDTVQGMQPRYTLPVLVFPVLALAFPQKLRRRCSPAARWMAIALAAGLFLLSAHNGWQWVMAPCYGV